MPVALLFIVAILFIRECHSMLNLKSSLWKSSAIIALMLGFGASTAHAGPMSATLSYGGAFFAAVTDPQLIEGTSFTRKGYVIHLGGKWDFDSTLTPDSYSESGWVLSNEVSIKGLGSVSGSRTFKGPATVADLGHQPVVPNGVSFGTVLRDVLDNRGPVQRTLPGGDTITWLWRDSDSIGTDSGLFGIRIQGDQARQSLFTFAEFLNESLGIELPITGDLSLSSIPSIGIFHGSATLKPVPVPEPAALAMLGGGLGLLGLLMAWRRRRAAA